MAFPCRDESPGGEAGQGGDGHGPGEVLPPVEGGGAGGAEGAGGAGGAGGGAGQGGDGYGPE